MVIRHCAFISRAAAVVTCCACGASIARGEELPIVNPSFEDVSRPLEIGEQTNGAAGAGVPVATRFPWAGGGVRWENPVEVSGWRTRYRPPPDSATLLAGVLNPPPLSDEPFLTGQDGEYVWSIQAAQVGQTLNVQLQPDTHYHLDFLGGIGRFGTDYFLAVSLIAVSDLQTLPIEGQPGVSRLVITQGMQVPPDSHGLMLPYSLDYTTPEVLPPSLEGKYVGIHMYGSDGIPRVNYDDFRLTAARIPEPATAFMVGSTMLIGMVGRKRHREGVACPVRAMCIHVVGRLLEDQEGSDVDDAVDVLADALEQPLLSDEIAIGGLAMLDRMRRAPNSAAMIASLYIVRDRNVNRNVGVLRNGCEPLAESDSSEKFVRGA